MKLYPVKISHYTVGSMNTVIVIASEYWMEFFLLIPVEHDFIPGFKQDYVKFCLVKFSDNCHHIQSLANIFYSDDATTTMEIQLHIHVL